MESIPKALHWEHLLFHLIVIGLSWRSPSFIMKQTRRSSTLQVGPVLWGSIALGLAGSTIQEIWLRGVSCRVMSSRAGKHRWVRNTTTRSWWESIWMLPKNRGTPKSSILIGKIPYKPSILGYHYFWKHPFGCRIAPLPPPIRRGVYPLLTTPSRSDGRGAHQMVPPMEVAFSDRENTFQVSIQEISPKKTLIQKGYQKETIIIVHHRQILFFLTLKAISFTSADRPSALLQRGWTTSGSVPGTATDSWRLRLQLYCCIANHSKVDRI